jgi:hypothetical protein
MSTKTTLYDTDFYAWTQEQAALLRDGAVQELDLANLAEEIESLGKRDRRALGSDLEVVLIHLLKWQHQPGKRVEGYSWYDTITEHRGRIEQLLEDNPSLRGQVSTLLTERYPKARDRALMQMAPALPRRHDELLPRTPQDLLREAASVFPLPPTCPWTSTEVLDDDFWPEPQGPPWPTPTA